MGVKEHLDVNGANHLTLHGVDLVSLCKKFGTPLFVFDEASLVENFERFKKAFESVYPKVMVCYSVKTNNNLAVCKILRERGAYAEVSSGLDLHIALKAGFSGEHIIFDGPFKPVEVLEEAVKSDVLLINCESFAELERLNIVAERLGVKQSVGLRVNPFKSPRFFRSLHPKTLLEEAAFCFAGCRFGFSLGEIHEAFKRLKSLKHLRLECLMTHPYHRAVDVLMPLFREAVENFGFEIKYLNIGGGFDPGTSGSTGDLLLALRARTVNVTSGKYSFKIMVPKTIKEADLRINVPKIKYSTEKVKITCALKNIFGCNPYPKKYRYHPVIDEAIVAINKAMGFHLHIIDANIVSGVQPKRLGLVMASQDPVALDTAASKIASVNPKTIKYLQLAQKEGLGKMAFTTKGEPLGYFKAQYPKKAYKTS